LNWNGVLLASGNFVRCNLTTNEYSLAYMNKRTHHLPCDVDEA
jgi:hypothetical protein